jgi:uncharacterized protein
MSNPLLLIDNIAFAKKNELIQGVLSLGSFPRLAELLKHTSEISNLADKIEYVLHGETSNLGQHYLHLTIKADLTTACQRCMSAMPLIINLNFVYLISDVNDADFEALDVDNNDDYDLQQANQAMDVVALIEDEVIIAMPIASMHEDTCKEMVMQSGEKPNPFAVLKTLIKP